MDEQDGNYDYRWVLTVPRRRWNDYLLTVDLPDSHVKEHVSNIGTDDPDHVLYDAVLDIWTRVYRMQSGVNPFAARRSYQNDFDWDSIPDLDDTDPTPPRGIPRVDKNLFAEAARDVSKSVTGVVSLADYQEEEDDRGVTVMLTDGTEFDLDIESTRPKQTVVRDRAASRREGSRVRHGAHRRLLGNLRRRRLIAQPPHRWVLVCPWSGAEACAPLYHLRHGPTSFVVNRPGLGEGFHSLTGTLGGYVRQKPTKSNGPSTLKCPDPAASRTT